MNVPQQSRKESNTEIQTEIYSESNDDDDSSTNNTHPVQSQTQSTSTNHAQKSIFEDIQTFSDTPTINKKHPGSTRYSSFNTKSSFYKALAKVKASLPKNKNKATEIIKYLCLYYNVSSSSTISVQSKNQKKSIINVVSEKVKKFYELDTISRQYPGKRDVLKINGTDYQKRVMLMPINEAFSEFKIYNRNLTVGRSRFHALRPKYVLTFTHAVHAYCCCCYCENVSLLFDTFKTILCMKSVNELLKLLFCSLHSYECVSGMCDVCFHYEKKFLNLFDLNMDKIFQFYQWEKDKDGFMVKNFHTSHTIAMVTKRFIELLKPYKLHQYLIFIQAQSIQNVKELQIDSEIMIVLDFSENFSTTSQKDIQSAFFSKKQISLFTAIRYHAQNPPQSFVFINDDTSHSKNQVYFYISLMIEEIKKDVPFLKHVTFVSDGCSGQFKNRFIMLNLLYTIEDFGCSSQWIFTPTGHGKNAVDGVGGTLKRQVYNRVMTGKNEVYTAYDFFKCASEFSLKTKLFYVDQKDVEEMNRKILNSRWAKVKAVPGTRSFHHFTHSEDGKYLIASVSSLGDGQKVFKMR